MKVDKKYFLPYCSSYIFFEGRFFEQVLDQNILKPSHGSLRLGVYNAAKEKIVPVMLSLGLSAIEQMCREQPNSILAHGLESPLVCEAPLVSGKVGIYPNWKTFSIEGIIRPDNERVYMTQIDGTVAEIDYKVVTRDRLTGETRVEFIGSGEQFDPISRGLRTWAKYRDLYMSPNGETLPLVIELTPQLIKRIMTEYRNKGGDEYGRFIGRICRLDESIRHFLRYSNLWARAQTKKKRR